MNFKDGCRFKHEFIGNQRSIYFPYYIEKIKKSFKNIRLEMSCDTNRDIINLTPMAK